jgi:hypothetical protein
MHRDSNIGIQVGYKKVYLWSHKCPQTAAPRYEGLLLYLDDAMLYSLFLSTKLTFWYLVCRRNLQ